MSKELHSPYSLSVIINWLKIIKDAKGYNKSGDYCNPATD
jgi:hypothetical protein